MKLSTYINAAIWSRVSALNLLDACIKYKLDTASLTWHNYKRRQTQSEKFHARAIQLADEQHDLIIVQAQLLERFEMAMEEAHG